MPLTLEQRKIIQGRLDQINKIRPKGKLYETLYKGKYDEILTIEDLTLEENHIRIPLRLINHFLIDGLDNRLKLRYIKKDLERRIKYIIHHDIEHIERVAIFYLNNEPIDLNGVEFKVEKDYLFSNDLFGIHLNEPFRILIPILKHSNIRRFIFCDYRTFDFYNDENTVFPMPDGITILETSEIGPNILIPNAIDWNGYWHADSLGLGNEQPNSGRAFKLKCRYQSGDSEISFDIIVYKTEAIRTYELITHNYGSPSVIHISDFHGFWAPIQGEDSLLFQVASNSQTLPKYIVFETNPNPNPNLPMNLYEIQPWNGYFPYGDIGNIYTVMIHGLM